MPEAPGEDPVDTKFSDVAKAAPEKRSRGARVSGIDRALQILDFLQAEMKPVGAYAVAKAVGAPLSTVYVIIEDLVEKRLLQRRNDGTVWLPPAASAYGLALLSHRHLVSLHT